MNRLDHLEPSDDLPDFQPQAVSLGDGVVVMVLVHKDKQLAELMQKADFWEVLQETAEEAAESGVLPAEALAHIKAAISQKLRLLAAAQN